MTFNVKTERAVAYQQSIIAQKLANLEIGEQLGIIGEVLQRLRISLNTSLESSRPSTS